MRMSGREKETSGDALIWRGGRVIINQPCIIGRAENNDVVLGDAEVSRQHAMIFNHGGKWWLNDMGSRNGVRVNGVRLTHSHCLRDGDEVLIGAHKLVFQAAGEARPRSRIRGPMTRIAGDAGGVATPGRAVCETIVTSVKGEILEGEKAARWFFGDALERGPEGAHCILPSHVRIWLQRQASQRRAGIAPLELQEPDRRVVVTLDRRDKDRFFLVMREESDRAVIERLQSLALSRREAEVMRWVCEGKANSEIAAILDVTVHTVNRHMEHVLAKLGVDNRQKAIVAVMERLGAS